MVCTCLHAWQQAQRVDCQVLWLALLAGSKRHGDLGVGDAGGPAEGGGGEVHADQERAGRGRAAAVCSVRGG